MSTGTPSTVSAPLSTPPARSRSSICLRILCDTPSTNTLDWAEGEGGQVRVRQSRTLEEMGDGIEGAKHTYLDEVVAEGEEGVEGADAEVRDVELRGGSGRGQVRSGQASFVLCG